MNIALLRMLTHLIQIYLYVCWRWAMSFFIFAHILIWGVVDFYNFVYTYFLEILKYRLSNKKQVVSPPYRLYINQCSTKSVKFSTGDLQLM